MFLTKTGLGRILLVDTLRMVQPDVVIQVVCTSQGRNLPTMDPALVASSPGWLTSTVRHPRQPFVRSDIPFSYTYMYMLRHVVEFSSVSVLKHLSIAWVLMATV